MNRRNFLSFAPKTAAIAGFPALWLNAHAAEGLTSKVVTIGCSGALTGPLGGFGKSTRIGIDAALSEINAKGGIHGRTLAIDMVDDAYNPARTAENVKKMISDGSIFALSCCIGTPNNAAILPMVEESQIPYVSPITGASSLRKAGLNNVFHVRASYTDETQRLVQNIVSMGLKGIAIAYLDNAFGKEVLADAQKALTAAGVKAVIEAPVAADGKNLPEAVASIMAAKPGAIFLATAGAASVTLLTAIKKVSPTLPIVSLSVAFSADGLKQLGEMSSGIAITTVIPDPNRTRLAVQRDYHAAMRSMGNTDFASGSVEGYIAIKIIAEGLDRAGKEPTRAKFRTAVAGLRNHDLGGFNINYGGSPYVGSKYIDLAVLSANGRIVG
jgi:branched-chain amino acid transport system substrate-binding protein